MLTCMRERVAAYFSSPVRVFRLFFFPCLPGKNILHLLPHRVQVQHLLLYQCFMSAARQKCSYNPVGFIAVPDGCSFLVDSI